ncbi:hypothetical protein SAMN04488096_103242 [Mesonia phycicola]|uniref:EpsG family protein n=1 Tax=Mesonia phycicola TaxID=579105 RepID=A0A1M6D0B8_9FLAO|nr:DUF6427 family protein [Mesonia phycicola]SHI66722.1 hypothetical protein SAMN04488096_103242 [Mesonia phycicola]
MLASFFKKSKPINFVLVGLFMSLFFLAANIFVEKVEFSLFYFLSKIGLLLAYLFLMMLINFIVKRNEVTKRNTFTIFLFAVFTVLFFPVLQADEVIISSLCVLLALRRLVSLRSEIFIKRKIFDTSFWVAVAFLCYPESVLFVLLPFIGVLMYARDDFKNWLIPFFAIISVFAFKTAFNLLFYNQFFNPFAYLVTPSLDLNAYREFSILFPLSVLIVFAVWVLFVYFKTIPKVSRAIKSTLYIVLVTLIISIFVVIFDPNKNGAELLFFILPVCIIGANYFEQNGKDIFKEILLISLLVLTFIVPFIA